MSKKSQVTIFIIVAIVIVVLIISVFLLRDRVFSVQIPQELEPVYSYYTSCIEQATIEGIGLMGTQAGYIKVPEFEAGSNYMPFSSQLSFLGTGIPYWYYVSGNNIQKEQVPTKETMEEQLSEYVAERLQECDFSSFSEKGFGVEIGEAEVSVVIQDTLIDVSVNQEIGINFSEISYRQSSHTVEVSSSLGKFYNLAKKIYDKELQESFLENYAIDNLRLYAPVDGVDISCSPKVWMLNEVRTDLQEAVQVNTQMIKIAGEYYGLSNPEHNYFVQDIGEDVGSQGEAVNFVYLKDEFPFKFDVEPRENGMLIAEPVGLQEGMGMLGFCYIPYHYVYDIAYPVLVQIYDSDTIFQFPVAVVIDKNMPREALNVEGLPDAEPELCKYKNNEVRVYTYNTKLEPVPAKIKFKCFATSCDLGNTELDGEDAVLNAAAPQCANAFIIASAENYSSKKYMIGGTSAETANLVLDKLYTLDLDLKIDGRDLGNNRAIISFKSDDNSVTLAYPEQREIQLSAGDYNIEVVVYRNTSLSLSGFSTRECINVPTSGIFGIFGGSEEKCFNLEVPGQIISQAVAGGGDNTWYISESELESSKKIIISGEGLPVPQSIEELQKNYDALKDKSLSIDFE